MTLTPGEHIAVVGANGSGKSTLLHTLAGELPPLEGTVRLGPRTVRRLYRQDLGRGLVTDTQSFASDEERTVLADLLADHPIGAERGRTMLGALLFSGDDVVKLVGGLSGGERARLLMGKLALEPTNLLLLDEPQPSRPPGPGGAGEGAARLSRGHRPGQPRPRPHRRPRHRDVGHRGGRSGPPGDGRLHESSRRPAGRSADGGGRTGAADSEPADAHPRPGRPPGAHRRRLRGADPGAVCRGPPSRGRDRRHREGAGGDPGAPAGSGDLQGPRFRERRWAASTTV